MLNPTFMPIYKAVNKFTRNNPAHPAVVEYAAAVQAISAAALMWTGRYPGVPTRGGAAAQRAGPSAGEGGGGTTGASSSSRVVPITPLPPGVFDASGGVGGGGDPPPPPQQGRVPAGGCEASVAVGFTVCNAGNAALHAQIILAMNTYIEAGNPNNRVLATFRDFIAFTAASTAQSGSGM